MGFSYNKATLLCPNKEKKLSTFIIAIITATAFFLPFIILGKGYFIFYGDFNVQQIPFYMQCHNAIRNGTMGWNWLTDLGANFVGSYSFYLLGSPFFWLTIPFPNSVVPYLMGPLLILKFGCAAFTAYLYIRRFTKTPEAARLGALLYAFSGFSIYNIFFNHFHEAIIVFPLLLLAIEMLITENKRGVVAITVALCAVVNYFFFFGMVVFSIIYFFVRLFSHAIKPKFSRFLILVLEAVIGLSLACFLLIPSILAIIGNGRISEITLGWNSIMYGKEQIYLNVIECFFFPPDIPARPVFFPGADVKWSSLGGWMPIFSMVGVFAWFANRKGNWLKRLIGISAFMALVPILNSSFYAFNNAYYARWFYMPILMMALATVMLAEDSSADWSSGFKWVLGITFAFTLVIGLFPQTDEDGNISFGLYTQDAGNTYTLRFIAACLIAIISLFVLYLLLGLLKRNRKAFFTASVACVCIASIVYGGLFIYEGRSHSFDPKSVVIDQLIEGDVALEKSYNYRVDTYSCADNTSMTLGLAGINAFHSVVPSSIIDFYTYIGVTRDVGSRPEVNQYAIRPLLSVKYLLNRTGGESFVENSGDTKMPYYKYVTTSGGYYIYQNECYIPYGFSYDYYMSKSFCDNYKQSDRGALMLKAIALSDRQIKEYSGILDNIEDLKKSGANNSKLSLTQEAYKADCKELSKTSAYYFNTTKNGFTAKVKREKKNLVFFSVPYDEGWSATVNGKPAKIERVNVGFMAVLVPKGDSTIEFSYKTPGLSLGLKTTAGGVAVFIVYMLVCLIYKKNHPSEEVYPEGDILLEQWKTQESEEDEALSNPSRKSILDDDDEIIIPHIESGFEGGFKIDDNLFGGENKEE